MDRSLRWCLIASLRAKPPWSLARTTGPGAGTGTLIGWRGGDVSRAPREWEDGPSRQARDHGRDRRVNPLRRPFIAGNWKMNAGGHEAGELAELIARAAEGMGRVDVLVAPPF